MAREANSRLPSGLSFLKNIDALLRCPICFDFLSISMMTKCSHNFCSLCIRKFFSYKLQCPVCNSQATEQDLRNNRLLDELIAHFHAARQPSSKAASESPPPPPPPSSPKTPAVKRKPLRDAGQRPRSAALSHFFQKRPRASPSEETRRDGSVDVPSAELQTARHANASDLLSAAANVKEEPMDVEEGAGWNGGGGTSEEAASPSKDVKPVIKVECPVCSVNVSQQFINKHLDVCLSRGDKKDCLRSSAGRSRRPMGKVVYNLLSLHELKRRLRDCHLSAQGSRDQLVRRHQEFVHVYNAQCDALQPKSAQEIAREVEANEKLRKELQKTAKPVLTFSRSHSEVEIDELHSNYRKQHSSDFSRLIAEVRGRLGPARKTRVKEEHQNVQEDQETLSAESKLTLKTEDLEEVKDPPGGGEEEEEEEEGGGGGGLDLLSSPTNSEVSISSSISDIFGPEPGRSGEDAKRSAGPKTNAHPVSSPIPGKRLRKT